MAAKYVNYADPSTSCGKAISQMEAAMSNEWAVRGALMPDMHAGYALPIGAVVETKDVVVPSWVGYDIGCGMSNARILNITPREVKDNAAAILKAIKSEIPLGNNRYKVCQYSRQLDELFKLPHTQVVDDLLRTRANGQLGTLGGGNHFIEIGVNSDSEVFVTIHSGSRGLGHAVATNYMHEAQRLRGTCGSMEGNYPLNAESALGQAYVQDAYYAQEWALMNRRLMMEKVIHCINQIEGLSVGMSSHIINRNHNHVERIGNGNFIHRKGATHASEGMEGVIPGNMRDGCFIVTGKGNEDWLNSSSHGAGRVMSRAQAKREISLETMQEQMKGITGCVSHATLDEAPDAYKNIFEVMELQKPTVEVIDYITPMINVKG